MNIYKRKPFFIKGNFQLIFILCYIAILAVGIFFCMWRIFSLSHGLLEEAAFSSHMAWSSSGELFLKTILDANTQLACFSILAGLAVICAIHVYLERLFRILADGLKRIANGDLSYRLKEKGSLMSRFLISDFNKMVFVKEKKMVETADLLAVLKTKAEKVQLSFKDLSEIQDIHDKLSEKISK